MRVPTSMAGAGTAPPAAARTPLKTAAAHQRDPSDQDRDSERERQRGGCEPRARQHVDGLIAPVGLPMFGFMRRQRVTPASKPPRAVVLTCRRRPRHASIATTVRETLSLPTNVRIRATPCPTACSRALRSARARSADPSRHHRCGAEASPSTSLMIRCDLQPEPSVHQTRPRCPVAYDTTRSRPRTANIPSVGATALCKYPSLKPASRHTTARRDPRRAPGWNPTEERVSRCFASAHDESSSVLDDCGYAAFSGFHFVSAQPGAGHRRHSDAAPHRR
jgi:hypothetical protein